jgi:hypothetical protein
MAAGKNIEQTFAILDLKGVGIRHLTGAVKKMLQQIIQVAFPAAFAIVPVLRISRHNSAARQCHSCYDRALDYRSVNTSLCRHVYNGTGCRLEAVQIVWHRRM